MTKTSGVFLKPALEYEGEIYIAPLFGQHLDALPNHLAAGFHQKALSGDDISAFNFGFVNDAGDFLNREDALKYAIDCGLVRADTAKRTMLTSSMLVECARTESCAPRASGACQDSNSARVDNKELGSRRSRSD